MKKLLKMANATASFMSSKMDYSTLGNIKKQT